MLGYTCMYGCELLDLNCNDVTDFNVAWRTIKRHIWASHIEHTI